MQPLQFFATTIGALPTAAFLLTVLLTDGAPLKPIAPGEGSGPAAAIRAQPQAQQERQSRVAAVGHNDLAHIVPGTLEGESAIPLPRGAGTAGLVNANRDTEVFMTLFGIPSPYVPPAP